MTNMVSTSTHFLDEIALSGSMPNIGDGIIVVPVFSTNQDNEVTLEHYFIFKRRKK